MLKSTVGLVALVVLTMFGPTSPQKGCGNAIKATTHLSYFPVRDMRTSVALLPQNGFYRAPDTLSVPVQGREPAFDRAKWEVSLVNPVPATDASIALGEQKFQKTCIPCHGKSMAGDGPVAAKFVPPPDLLGSSGRGRTDGFIYSYIRHGGAIMPSYGAQVAAEEAWHLINYIRSMQKKNPR